MRCYGFLSGPVARCTRKEYAKGVQRNEDTGTYSHILDRNCRCGTRHPAPRWWPARVSRYPYTENGEVVGTHIRRDWPDGKKTISWSGLKGREPKALPLYGAEALDVVPKGTPVS